MGKEEEEEEEEETVLGTKEIVRGRTREVMKKMTPWRRSWLASRLEMENVGVASVLITPPHFP